MKIFRIVGWFFCVLFILQYSFTRIYSLPYALNLGATNILDGGPIRNLPGWYYEQFNYFYHGNKFVDAFGKNADPINCPKYNSFTVIPEVVYEWEPTNFLGGSWGVAAAFPVALYLNVTKNALGFTSSGAGFSNIILGLYNQWQAIMYKGRPLFIHRIEFDLFLPVGTNKYPEKTINPGDILTYIDPYWAATLYLTEKFALSWRAFYLFCGQDKKTKITPGQTFHLNYSMEYNIFSDCWVGINGYYLQQLKNNKLCGLELPNTKERVFSVGPGIVWFLPKEIFLFGHVYFESKARNRTQGISSCVLLVKHF